MRNSLKYSMFGVALVLASWSASQSPKMLSQRRQNAPQGAAQRRGESRTSRTSQVVRRPFMTSRGLGWGLASRL